MYSKKKKNGRGDSGTILGEGSRLEGVLFCGEFLKVEGTVKGEITVDRQLVVGPEGRIEGEIKSEHLIVFGEIEGKINADTVEIKSTGKIFGELATGVLVTEPGGILKGSCEMKKPGGETQAGREGARPFSSAAEKPAG